MKLSKKKETQLYGVVYEEIMQARLKIWKIRFDEKPSMDDIDNILSALCIKAPQKAIDCARGMAERASREF